MNQPQKIEGVAVQAGLPPFHGVRLHWETARGVGAIAMARLHTSDATALERALGALTGSAAGSNERAIPVGAIVHRTLAEIDDGIVARSSSCSAWVFPHGGPYSCTCLREWMCSRGAAIDENPSPRDAFPEAADDTEAAALQLLAHAASARAVPLLLAQSMCRRRVGPGWQPTTDDLSRSRRLMHWIDPPCIVAVGQTNVGKSSLLNALAGRCIAIAFDAEGTTRDAVAAQLTLDGLVADWFDTPGIRDDADAVERAAHALLEPLRRRADLLIEVSAPGKPCPTIRTAGCTAARLRVCTHADRDTARESAEAKVADVCVSCTERTGLDALAVAVRRALIADADLVCDDPWVFQPAAPLPNQLGTPTHE